ncbi:MAG: MBL fold metallo-hydrolase [Pseudoalteromonadaceae bacterium]|nr:MBL fold metallo-hydrolase [Pseudoalteromonadaceae bacterium]
MKVKFYGVRGSMPSPGEHTHQFGGNTSCVYVEQTNGKSLILDSGTGIAQLGEKLIEHTTPIAILLTHNHWDHIQGFPFFKPIYQADRDITIVVGDVEDEQTKNAILMQMSGSFFPVSYQHLPANITLNTQLATQKNFTLNSFNVFTAPLNHPGGGTAYCVHAEGKKIAYITDNELAPPGVVKTTVTQWAEFIKSADLLIHDAQFTTEELTLKHGWGHSTFKQVAELAMQSCIKNLAIISHDPARTDDELLAIETHLQANYGEHINIECAREGRTFEFTPSKD